MINEIWEGLRLLPFFSSPKRGFYGGKRGFRILATRRPTPGQGWPLLLLHTSRRPCRQAAGRKARRPAVPVRGYRPFGVVWPHGWGQTKKECGRHCNRPTGPRRLPAGLRPPVAWWCAAGPVAGRRGLRRPVAPPARKPGATAPRPSGRHQGAGPAGRCGPPAVRVEAVPPWRRGGFWGLPAAPGVAASPGPSPARPRLWSILGGAPQSPAARVGPAVRNGCVPWRRQAPVFSVAPGPQRGAGT